MNINYLLIKTISLSLAGALSLSSTQAAPIGTGQMLGQWAGALPVPGGSRQVFISVSAQADGTPTAVLRMDAGRLHNSTMRVVSTADSVVFYADKVGCRFAGQPVANGQRLRGQWQQPGFRAMLVLDRVATDKAPEISEAPAYKTEEVHVSSPSSPSPEIGLGGTLRLPTGTGPFPAVVLLPDVSTPEPAVGDYNLTNALADYLTRQGVAVLRLDDRGTGRSVGVTAATAGTQLVADAQSAMAYLRAKPGIDPLRVGLLGHGEGANVALLAGAQTPAPAFLVALGAAGVNGQELLARQTALVNQPGEPDTAQIAWAAQAAQAMIVARREAKKQLAAGANPEQTQLRIAQEQLRLTTEARKRNDVLYKRQYALLEIIHQTADNAQAQAIVANMLKQIYPSLSPAAAQIRARQLTSPWYRAFLTFNPQAELAKVACPTLLLHGTADTQVQLAANLPALEKGLKNNKHLNVQKLDGLNHEFQAPLSEQALAAGTTVRPTVATDVLETVGEWVMQQLK